MLPDFPDTKTDLAARLRQILKQKTLERSVLASLAKSYVQHEGTIHSYPQEGFGTITEGFQEFRVPIKLTLEELKNLTGAHLNRKLDELAEKMAAEISAHGQSVLDRVTKKAGNVFDAGGAEFSKDHFLELLGKVDMTFGSNKKPEIVWVAHPDMVEAMQKAWPVWEKDKEFMKRYEALIERKREEWLDRESHRKLVD